MYYILYIKYFEYIYIIYDDSIKLFVPRGKVKAQEGRQGGCPRGTQLPQPWPPAIDQPAPASSHGGVAQQPAALTAGTRPSLSCIPPSSCLPKGSGAQVFPGSTTNQQESGPFSRLPWIGVPEPCGLCLPWASQWALHLLTMSWLASATPL